MTNDYTFDKIEAWLSGELPEAEARAFEAELATDASLAQEVERHWRGREALDRLAGQSLQLDFARWRETLDDIPAPPSDALPIVEKPKLKMPNWSRRLAGAVLLLMLAGAIWFLTRNTTRELEKDKKEKNDPTQQKTDVPVADITPSTQPAPESEKYKKEETTPTQQISDVPVADITPSTQPSPESPPNRDKSQSPQQADSRKLIAMADTRLGDFRGTILAKYTGDRGDDDERNPFFTAGLLAFQNNDACAASIIENNKINGIHLVRTSSLTVVARGSYKYSVEFFTNEKGVFVRFTSVGSIEFNQDDQAVFVDASGREQAYKFVGKDEVLAGAVPTHRNNLRIDLDALQWLSDASITGISFVKIVDREKYKFTINPNRQAEFKTLVSCFKSILEREVVKGTPSVAAKQNLLQVPPDDPYFPAAQEMLAWLFFREKNYTEAARRYESFAKQTSDPTADWRLVQFYLADYDTRKAGFWKKLNEIIDPANQHRYREEAKKLKRELSRLGVARE